MAEHPGISNSTMTDDDTEDASYFLYELSEPQDDLGFYNAYHEGMEEKRKLMVF